MHPLSNGAAGEEEEEQGEHGGGWRERLGSAASALGRRSVSLLHGLPRPHLRVSWPAMAAALSLALLLLGGGLLVRRQARAQEGLAALHAQLGLQQRMAGTAAARQQRQVADLELSLQQMGSRLASSAATVAALEQRVEAHSTVSTSLRAELSAVRDGMAQLQLASAAAAAGVAGNATSDAAGEAALAAWQRLQQMVQGKVAAALELFAADGTGLPDYALAAAGATVVAHSPAHTAPGTDSTLLSRLRSGGVHPQANKVRWGLREGLAP